MSAILYLGMIVILFIAWLSQAWLHGKIFESLDQARLIELALVDSASYLFGYVVAVILYIVTSIVFKKSIEDAEGEYPGESGASMSDLTQGLAIITLVVIPLLLILSPVLKIVLF